MYEKEYKINNLSVSGKKMKTNNELLLLQGLYTKSNPNKV